MNLEGSEGSFVKGRVEQVGPVKQNMTTSTNDLYHHSEFENEINTQVESYDKVPF